MKRLAALLLMGVVCYGDEQRYYARVEVSGESVALPIEMDTDAGKAGIALSDLQKRLSVFWARLGLYFENPEKELWLYRWSRSETNSYLVGVKSSQEAEPSTAIAKQFADALKSDRLYMYWYINDGPKIQIERLREDGRQLITARIFGVGYDHLPFWIFGQDDKFRDYLSSRHKMRVISDDAEGVILRVQEGRVIGDMKGIRDSLGRLSVWEARINGDLFQRISHSDYNEAGIPRDTAVEYFAFGASRPVKHERYRVEVEHASVTDSWNAILPFTNRIHGHDYRTYRDVIVDTNLNYVERRPAGKARNSPVQSGQSGVSPQSGACMQSGRARQSGVSP